MIVAVDTETYEEKDGIMRPILNSKAFKIGCVLEEKGKKSYFETPKEMKEYIIKLIERNWKNHHNKTYIYGFNHMYDIYGYLGNEFLTNPRFETLRFKPLIMYYKDEKGKSIGFFLDLTNLGWVGMSLEMVGNELGLYKKKLPAEVRSVEELKERVGRDCEIVMEAVKRLRSSLEVLGFRTRKLITAGQVSRCAFRTFLKRENMEWLIGYKGFTYKSRHSEKIANAYRGPRNQAFYIGEAENATMIDMNGMYPWCMANMEFPNLQKEMYVEEPDECILGWVGVAEATVKTNPELKIGYLPIRYKGNRYPIGNKKMTGTWTLLELRRAKELGYKIEKINWAVVYPKMDQNPFRKYMKLLWEKRLECDKVTKSAIKMVMNSLYGKFGEHKVCGAIRIVRKADFDENEKGIKIIGEIPHYFMTQEITKNEYSRFAHPIIAAYTTAMARDRLYMEMSKIPREDLLYCDTDSIIFKGNHIGKMEIGRFELGKFKIEGERKHVHIKGEKRYSYGSDTKISGLRGVGWKRPEMLDETAIMTKKQIGPIKAMKRGDLEMMGTFEAYLHVIRSGSKHDAEMPDIIIEDSKEEQKKIRRP